MNSSNIEEALSEEIDELAKELAEETARADEAETALVEAKVQIAQLKLMAAMRAPVQDARARITELKADLASVNSLCMHADLRGDEEKARADKIETCFADMVVLLEGCGVCEFYDVYLPGVVDLPYALRNGWLTTIRNLLEKRLGDPVKAEAKT